MLDYCRKLKGIKSSKGEEEEKQEQKHHKEKERLKNG